MTSKPVAQLLIDLGVARSHSRAHVSNNNPYSEAQFKTLKYCPAFPGHFARIEDARAFCAACFDHCNHERRHAGIGLHTPASVHYGTAGEIRGQRAVTLDAAYAANPPDSGPADPPHPSYPPSPGSRNQHPKRSSNPHKGHVRADEPSGAMSGRLAMTVLVLLISSGRRGPSGPRGRREACRRPRG